MLLSENTLGIMQSFKLKILLLNLGFTGKNALFKGLMQSCFDKNYRLNLGVNVFVKDIEMESGDTVTMSFWDVCDKEHFKFFHKSLYKGAMGVIFIFNLSDKKSYEVVKNQLVQIQNVTNKRLPYIIIGNFENDAQPIINIDELREKTESEGGIYLQISEIKNFNINKAVLELAHRIVGSRINIPNQC